MSWEKMNTRECSCPCGQGRVYIEDYSDDWNRTETRGPYICCSQCTEAFHIERFQYTRHPGNEYYIYYCVSNDYPAYSGTPYSRTNIGRDNPPQHFIENYTLDELKGVLSVFEQYKSYVKIPDKGVGSTAREIVRRYKSFCNTQRISTIAKAVTMAINDYYAYDLRFDSLERGKAEYADYVSKKQQSSFRLEI